MVSGNIGFENLIDTFGYTRSVFGASLHTLRVVPGIGKITVANIKDFNEWNKIEEELELIKKHDARIITYQDHIYPKSLLNIYDFPPFLYVKELLHEVYINIAVIGSRLVSTYSKFSAERLCRELALKDITVVSGLARGIDMAAHQGALTVEGAPLPFWNVVLMSFILPKMKNSMRKLFLKAPS